MCKMPNACVQLKIVIFCSISTHRPPGALIALVSCPSWDDMTFMYDVIIFNICRFVPSPAKCRYYFVAIAFTIKCGCNAMMMWSDSTNQDRERERETERKNMIKCERIK